MKKKTLIIFFYFFAIFGFGQGWRAGEMELKVFTHSETELKNLSMITSNMDACSTDNRIFRVYAIQSELKKIKESGLEYEITIPDLNEHYKHFWDNALVPPGYYSYEQIIAVADSLSSAFPSICKKEIWGTSLGGRQLAALKISDNVNQDENEPEIMFDGGIHGDEIGGAQNVIMFARELCLKYSIDPTITDLINSREIWLYLMVNPDGRVAMSRYNNAGVDCNRDNGYMWDGEGFSPAPFSQPETKALRDGILANQFVVYTNYHSGTEIISYPWSYRTQAPRDYQHLDQLASVYSSTSGYPGGMVYGQGYNVMYAINGSTKDFVYGGLGQVGWSIEISNDKQPPSSMIQYYYDVNKTAMLEVIKRCGWGISGTVTDSVTGEPVRASVWANDLYPVYTDPVVGDYHKFLVPGTYSLTFRANGYKTKTIAGNVVPSQGACITNVQLKPDTGWYGYKLMSCRIPGNNFGDEGYTPGCLGKSDGVPYSMGKNGYLTLDMGDTLYNGPGNDVKIFQSGSTNKSYNVSGSLYLDGPFTQIGTGSGTTGFDLPSTLNKCRYLYIKDNGTGSASGTGAGFNLDAVAMLTPPLKVDFMVNNQNPCAFATVDFTDKSSGNPVSWTWSFPGGVPSASGLQNPTGIQYPTPGVYPVSLTISNGVSSLGKTKNGFITVKPSPVVYLGRDTILCDNQQITLDAGNPGCTWLWSNGATTQTIMVDSTGTGYGTAVYKVSVTSSNGCTASDSIQISFDNCSGMQQNEPDKIISIQPNPASDKVFIQFSGLSGGMWKIISTGGQILQSGTIDSEIYNVTIGLSGIKPGLLFLVAEKDDLLLKRKVMVTSR